MSHTGAALNPLAGVNPDGVPGVVQSEAKFIGTGPCYAFPTVIVYAIVLLVSLVFALGCIWRWFRSRTREDIRARCRISMFAAAFVVLFCSTTNLVLDYIVLVESLGGRWHAASGLRMLATSQSLEYFAVGFAVFSVIFLLALILGLFEPRAPAPPEVPGDRT